MNTLNVNVKTATKESSERWGADPKARLACVIEEQKSYLDALCDVWNLELSQKDEFEEILRLLSLMGENVYREGVLCWELSYPLVSFDVVQPWLQAKEHASRLYGIIGREAWDIARKNLCTYLRITQSLLLLEARYPSALRLNGVTGCVQPEPCAD